MRNSYRLTFMLAATLTTLAASISPSISGIVYREDRGVTCGEVKIGVQPTSIVVIREQDERCLLACIDGAAVHQNDGSDKSFEIRNIYRELPEIILFERIDRSVLRRLSVLFWAIGKDSYEGEQIQQIVFNHFEKHAKEIEDCLKFGQSFKKRETSCSVAEDLRTGKSFEKPLGTARLSVSQGSGTFTIFLPVRVD